MVSVIAKIPVQEDKAEEFLAALKELVASVAQEPGAVLYTANRSRSEPNTIVMMERYKDKAALDAHSSAPYLKAFFANMPEFLTGKPEVVVMEELFGI